QKRGQELGAFDGFLLSVGAFGVAHRERRVGPAPLTDDECSLLKRRRFLIDLSHQRACDDGRTFGNGKPPETLDNERQTGESTSRVVRQGRREATEPCDEYGRIRAVDRCSR